MSLFIQQMHPNITGTKDYLGRVATKKIHQENVALWRPEEEGSRLHKHLLWAAWDLL